MITVEGLTHYYGERRAIEGLSFTISQNECVGFLGRNGAGKSTTLKILAGLVVPSAGTVSLDGADLVSSTAAFRSRIGYLPEDPPLYKDMTVADYVLFCGQLKGMSGSAARARLPAALAATNLTEVKHRVIQELSHGYRQRCGIAQAIIHQPKLVVLDEPTNGLDPMQRVEMRDVVRNLSKTCTVLISSHNLPEIHETCDRILMLSKGRIVAQGSEAELAARAGQRGMRLTLTVRGDKALIERALAGMEGLNAMEVEPHAEGLVRLQVALGRDEREQLVARLVGAGAGIRRMIEDESELEEIFLDLTKEATS